MSSLSTGSAKLYAAPAAWSSVECAGRKDVAQRWAPGCAVRAVEPALGARGGGRLGLAGVRGDPAHDGRGVGARGDDGGALDHLAAGGMAPSETADLRADRVVFGWLRPAPGGPGVLRADRVVFGWLVRDLRVRAFVVVRRVGKDHGGRSWASGCAVG